MSDVPQDAKSKAVDAYYDRVTVISMAVMVVLGLIVFFGLPSVQLACNFLLVAVIWFGFRICHLLSVLRR